jgi:DNA-binding NarL/FixJ family response regulator
MQNQCAMVVEDYGIIAQAWGGILKKTEQFSGVHIYLDPKGIYEKVQALRPALILMDINLPGRKNGIEIMRELIIENPGLKVIIISMHNEQTFVRMAFAAGAKAYVTKSSPTLELKTAIFKALNDETYLCKELCA